MQSSDMKSPAEVVVSRVLVGIAAVLIVIAIQLTGVFGVFDHNDGGSVGRAHQVFAAGYPPGDPNGGGTGSEHTATPTATASATPTASH